VHYLSVRNFTNFLNELYFHDRKNLEYFLPLYLDKGINEALHTMRKYCLAAFHHYIKTNNNNQEEQHKFCPKTNDTWCMYQRDKLLLNTNNNTKIIKNRTYLDPIFGEILQPMIAKMTSKKLLRRCLRAITQNTNESLNSVVW
jgi:hypothetical protein